MIFDIVDERERPYRWARINAIIEATWHDNTVVEPDKAAAEPAEIEVTYEQREGVSLHEAIMWAEQDPCAVTLRIYDEGKGTYDERKGGHIA
jgi:hypothetical protein